MAIESQRPPLLQGLKKRGPKTPKLIIEDGHLGIWAAIRNVFPEAKEQRW